MRSGKFGNVRSLLSHEEYKEMTAAHALDALETAEARAMEEHLRTCDECRVDVDAWKETATSLAFATETAEPSEALRSQLLQRVRSLPDSELVRDNGSLESVTKNDAARSLNVLPLRESNRRAWNSRQTFGAIAASLIIVLLAVAVVVLWQRTRAMKTEIARLASQEQELTRLREEKGLLTSPDARVAALKGTEMAKGARAMLAYDQVTGNAMLVANGLPPAPKGKAYQLWFIREGKPPMPGGVFSTNATGHAELRDVIPLNGRDAGVFAVTLERAEGVSAPEGQMYLKSDAS